MWLEKGMGTSHIFGLSSNYSEGEPNFEVYTYDLGHSVIH